MTTARWVFEKAVHLMDEGDPNSGAADTAETAEYKTRVLSILNVLRLECFPYSDGWSAEGPGRRPVCPEIEDMDQAIPLDDGLCQGVLPYGLAAHLLLEEDPSLASFFQQRYQERLAAAGKVPGVAEDIADVYGGVEFGEFARW